LFLHIAGGRRIYISGGRKKQTFKLPEEEKEKACGTPLWEKHSPGVKIRENKSVTDEEIKHFIRCFKREEQVVRR